MNPSHDYLQTLIQAAEELGVTILRVGPQEITVTMPYGGHFVDVTIHAGPLLSATLLRSVLRPGEREAK